MSTSSGVVRAMSLAGVMIFGSPASAQVKVSDAPQLGVVLGDCELAINLARRPTLTVFFQSPSSDEIETIRQQGYKAGLLGTRLFVQQGDYKRLHLADDLADFVIVGKTAGAVAKAELLRIVRPQGEVWKDGER